MTQTSTATRLTGRMLEIVQQPNHAMLSVVRRDGSVLSVVIWAHPVDGAITVNSAAGRAWPDAVQRTGRATLTFLANGNPNEWLAVETILEGVTTAQAREHLDALSIKYFGAPYGALAHDEQRIVLTLRPRRVQYFQSTIRPEPPPAGGASFADQMGGVAAQTRRDSSA